MWLQIGEVLLHGSDFNDSNCFSLKFLVSVFSGFLQIYFTIIVLSVNLTTARKEQDPGTVFADEEMVGDDGFLRECLQNVITKKHLHLRLVHTERM